MDFTDAALGTSDLRVPYLAQRIASELTLLVGRSHDLRKPAPKARGKGEMSVVSPGFQIYLGGEANKCPGMKILMTPGAKA